MRLKQRYVLANCCQPIEKDSIIGYYSHNNIIKVHKNGCPNLNKAQSERLVSLSWKDIVDEEEYFPDNDYELLIPLDFKILRHHLDYGYDYSLKIAAMLHIDKQSVFETHNKLKKLGLLERVSPKIIRYRKNIVPGKWIKHRNHTYYSLTEKGRMYLEYYGKKKEN